MMSKAVERIAIWAHLREPAPVVGVIRLSGAISALGPLRRGLNLAALADPIERTFQLRHLRAVALAINSPGGSAVQTSLLATRIRALADEKGVKVYAFTEDVAASGGYWLACAADEIFANESSVVGSIGVVSASFGFTDLIRRVGVERRLHTAGPRKVMLDPFRREDEGDVERLKTIQTDIHESFKQAVRASRGDRLKGTDEELFSGEVWTGRRALDLGLVDGIGDLRGVMRERYGDGVRLRLVAGRRSWLRRRLSLPRGSAAYDAGDWAGGLLAAIEERLLWSRFGL